ncbi:hypothetical protein [Marinoscillum sp.]|uniref:hypothetical protein n=1 Tax=Marinoscillum sp. TaxID=2024838 RepID=UPI003BA9F064
MTERCENHHQSVTSSRTSFGIFVTLTLLAFHGVMLNLYADRQVYFSIFFDIYPARLLDPDMHQDDRRLKEKFTNFHTPLF